MPEEHFYAISLENPEDMDLLKPFDYTNFLVRPASSHYCYPTHLVMNANNKNFVSFGYNYLYAEIISVEVALVILKEDSKQNETISYCCICGKTIAEERHKIHYIKKGKICLSCFEKMYIQCQECHKIISKKNIKTHKDYCSFMLCTTCYNKLFKPCYNCNKVLFCDDMCKDRNGILYCQDCYKVLFTICSHCGNELKKDKIKISGRGRVVCKVCFEECKDAIEQYCYRPSLNFYKLKKEEDRNLFFGFEIEIEYKTGKINNRKIADKINSKYLYCKEDGSLINGFEIVSHPMTFQYFKKNEMKIMEKVYELSTLGYRSFETRTCGMHVHLTDSMSTSHRYKMLKFFYKNRMYIRKFSKRSTSSFNQWSAFNDHYANIREKARKSCDNNGKYECLNVYPKNTVEVRIFRGTLYRPSINKNIEFCIALYNFSKQFDAEDMKTNTFISYVEKHKKIYPNLAEENNKYDYNKFKARKIKEKSECV